MALVLCILGIVCVAYGASVMMLWSGTWFFAVWYAIGALFMLAAFAVHAGWWDAAPLAVRRSVQVVSALVVAVIVVTQACALSSFGAHGEDDLDYVVVLGAQVSNDRPSAVLRYRLDAAYDYLQENPDTSCIVSGGQGPNEPVPEAQVMASYLRQRGIEPERILIEDQSLNTCQNIRNSMQFFDAETARVGVVTNDFHVFRGVHIARKQGVEHVCGIAAKSTPWYLPNNLLRETLGITKDFVKGNL